jgi:hypothetical protein
MASALSSDQPLEQGMFCMKSPAVVLLGVAATFGCLLVASGQALAQTAPDDAFDPERAYLQQPHVRDMSTPQRQQLRAKLNAATVRNSAAIMAVLQRHGFTEVRASVNPKDDMLMLDLVGKGAGAVDSLPMEVDYALDALAQSLLTDFDGVVYIAGYLTMFNGVSRR